MPVGEGDTLVTTAVDNVLLVKGNKDEVTTADA
jgi:hypothetical protein